MSDLVPRAGVLCHESGICRQEGQPIEPTANVVPAWINGLKWNVDHLRFQLRRTGEGRRPEELVRIF